jgi:hypothetical protein
MGQTFRNSIKKINYLFLIVQELYIFLIKHCNLAFLRKKLHRLKTMTDKFLTKGRSKLKIQRRIQM